MVRKRKIARMLVQVLDYSMSNFRIIIDKSEGDITSPAQCSTNSAASVAMINKQLSVSMSLAGNFTADGASSLLAGDNCFVFRQRNPISGPESSIFATCSASCVFTLISNSYRHVWAANFARACFSVWVKGKKKVPLWGSRARQMFTLIVFKAHAFATLVRKSLAIRHKAWFSCYGFVRKMGTSQGVNLLTQGLALVRPVRMYQHSFGPPSFYLI